MNKAQLQSSDIMKKTPCSSLNLPSLLLRLLCCFVLAEIDLQAQNPILEYDFDSTGTVSSGSNRATGSMLNASSQAVGLFSTNGEGVTGDSGDYAFDNSASTGMGSAGTGGGFYVANSAISSSLAGMTSFTLTGWFCTGTTPINNLARLFEWSTSGTGFILYATGSGTLTLQINGTDAGPSTSGAYAAAGTWVFFAVAYDSTLQTVSYYEGTTTATATLVRTVTLNKGALMTTTANLAIGNSAASVVRPFDGLLDRMAIFGSTTDETGALTLAQIQAYQAETAENLNLLSRPEVRISGTYTYYALGNGYPVGNANYVAITPFTTPFYPGPPHVNTGSLVDNGARDGTLVDAHQLATSGDAATAIPIASGDLTDAPASNGTTGVGGYVGDWIGVNQILSGTTGVVPGNFDILFDLGASYRIADIEIVYTDEVGERIYAGTNAQQVYTATALSNPPVQSNFTLFASATSTPTVSGTNLLAITGTPTNARYVDIRLAVQAAIPGGQTSLGALIQEVRIKSDTTATVSGPSSTLVAAGVGTANIQVKVNSTSAASGRTATVNLSAYGTNTPVLYTGSATLAAVSGEQNIQVPINVTNLGLYTLTLNVTDSGSHLLCSRSSSFASVPTRTVVGPGDFGVNTHITQVDLPHVLNLIKLAGFSRDRDDFYWNDIEFSPGVYTFPTAMDRFVNGAASQGIVPLALLAYMNTLYGTDAFPYTSGEQTAFANYAASCVMHYSPKVKDWEVWNEPQNWGPATTAQYVPLLIPTYNAIHAADSTATVVSCGGGGAGGGPGADYETGVIANGGLNYQDAWSMHPYMTPDSPDLGYAAPGSPMGTVSVPAVWPYLAGFAANSAHIPTAGPSSGLKLPVWTTEIGWFSQGTTSSEYTQAAYLARTYLLGRRYGELTVPTIFWYDFVDDGTNPTDSEDNFGLIRADYSPKPSYVAAAVLTSTLGTQPYNQSLIENNTDKVIQYGTGASAVYAVWSVGAGPDSLTFPLPAGNWKLRNWEGQDTTFTWPGGTYNIQAIALPQYIHQ